MPEVTLHVCANLAREVTAALRARGHSGFRVVAFPPACGPNSAPAVPVPRQPDDLVVGGPCLATCAPGLRAGNAVAAPTCFHLVEDGARVDALLEAGAFLVTPGWLARWRRWIEASGLDRDGARALFGESARRVVLLDTGVDPHALETLEAFAAFVGLPWQRVAVGLEHVGLVVGERLLRARADSAEQRLADHAMALDALAALPATAGELQVGEELARLTRALCGAARAAFWPADVGGSGPRGPPRSVPAEAAWPQTPQEAARAAADARDGFVLPIGPQGAETGWLAVGGVQLPEHVERYRQVATTLAQAGHLALQNARQLRGMIAICFGCKSARDDDGRWQRIEAYLSARSAATFTHGLCPDCLERLYPEP